MDKKTQGYITLCMSHDQEQVKQAALLAKTIKLQDPEREICVVVSSLDLFPQEYTHLFDYMVELPYGVYDASDPPGVNIWQLYYCTPFDMNLYIDKQSILLDDISGIWANLVKQNLVFPSSVYNFKNEQKQEFLNYFKTNEKNNFPKYFTDIFFFKKSQESAEYFKMLDPVLQHWRSSYINIVPEHKPSKFNQNLLMNAVAKLVGFENPKMDMFSYTFVSLENIELDDLDIPQDWTEYVSSWVKDHKVKVGNHRQRGIVFYNSDYFVDQEIMYDFDR